MPRPPRLDFPPPALITTTEDLAALCDRLRAEDFVTVDTEFMRERTYWPELCVVQLAGDHEVAVVDAQAPGIDLAPLGALLADQAVMKVFHAARQDIEIFVLRFDAVPTPLFDTQIAAMVAGFGDQVGYDALVAALTGGHIDKAHRFSDWAARPLSAAQIAYAAADVTHLRAVYERLRARLERDGRLDWVAEEMAVLADPATYRADPETMWERLRPRSNNRRLLGVLRALAAWREREAQRVNIPRQRLLKDETLLEIAATAPDNAEALARARGISRGFAEGTHRRVAAGRDRGGEGAARGCVAGGAARPRRGAAVAGAGVAAEGAAGREMRAAPRRATAGRHSDDIDRLAREDAPDFRRCMDGARGVRRGCAGAEGGRVALGVDGRRVKLIPVAQ